MERIGRILFESALSAPSTSESKHRVYSAIPLTVYFCAASLCSSAHHRCVLLRTAVVYLYASSLRTATHGRCVPLRTVVAVFFILMGFRFGHRRHRLRYFLRREPGPGIESSLCSVAFSSAWSPCIASSPSAYTPRRPALRG